jgi:heavy metal translocating P-type ATPase
VGSQPTPCLNQLLEKLRSRQSALIAGVSLAAIITHLAMRYGAGAPSAACDLPLLASLALGGLPLVAGLAAKLARRQFGSDTLAGVSIVTSVLLHQYLAGAIVTLMLSGGETLEKFALRQASSVLRALAGRMPSIAHRREAAGMADVPISWITAGDVIVVHPHEICPVDGVVIEGRASMDESYLTGEPFQITKLPGSAVISGAVNGDSVVTVRATQRAADSRYAKIMEVMRESEQTRPRLRRLGDTLGAVYTPVALAIAAAAWAVSGDPIRFLAVLVIATPCPLLIGIPIAIIGSISLCARQSIVVRNPVALEQAVRCRTALFDKTGTLTYGEPRLTEQWTGPGFEPGRVLALAAGLERYSKHPLARAILAEAEARGSGVSDATQVGEQPGHGLEGIVAGVRVAIAGRGNLAAAGVAGVGELPPAAGTGLECVVAVDGRAAAVFRFRDAPRAESRSFIEHLGPHHSFDRLMIVSGDRPSEVRTLAGEVGITEVRAAQSPEQKLAIVRAETALARTLYVGDGINDAPAMMAATVGIAIGQNSDVTAEAADIVIMDNSLSKVDEFIHISRRMRSIALQTAIGGMAISIAGMAYGAAGRMSPVEGAVLQEIIDVVAVLNALRAAWPPRVVKH